ncbi:hypothetical protein VNI00_003197 [Paramarasmius palmivorus]|uniref:Uncharacterized protein n=1 Tax=Paramarasmius palmivorus TaxID=297713 RepID=A0AAW0DT63_9AGAR
MANHTSERLDREQIDLELYFPDKPRQEVLDSMYKLRFDTIYSTSLDAVARLPQEAGLEWHWGSGDYGLADRKPVGNELIRFTLASADDDDIFVAAKYDCEDIRGMSWLSQFSRCVEASENEDYFVFVVVIKPVYPTLQSTGSRGEREILADFFKLCDSEVPPPIYLFVYPVAFTTMAEVFSWVDGHTHSHYWSMDKAGLCKMTEDELEFWGVPKLVPSMSFNHHLTLISWPTSIYATLHNWQLFQGFEPSTAAFAHYIGYPELEILQTEICSDKGKQQELESKNTLWEAIPGSGISAFR